LPIPLRATNIKRKETNFSSFYLTFLCGNPFFSYLYSSYKYIVSLKWKLSFLLKKKMWRRKRKLKGFSRKFSFLLISVCTSMPAYSILSHHKPYVSILPFDTMKTSFPVDGFRFIFIMQWYTQFHAIYPWSPTLNVHKYSKRIFQFIFIPYFGFSCVYGMTVNISISWHSFNFFLNSIYLLRINEVLNLSTRC